WFAGNFAPRGFAIADGRLLPISTNSALFASIGTTYGGDGRTTFALPDLRGRSIVGFDATLPIGSVVGQDTQTLSEANLPSHTHQTQNPAGAETTSATGGNAPVDIRQPGLALNYEIARTGLFPSRNSLPQPDGSAQPLSSAAQGIGEDLIASVNIFAEDRLGDQRRSFANADGRLLPIVGNEALFSLVGTTYGGDGRTTFGLPDTRGRVVTGEGTGPGLTQRRLGQQQGEDARSLGAAQMPAHAHDDPDFGATLPAGGGQALGNLQEELTLNYAIALFGIFPSRSLLAEQDPDAFLATGGLQTGGLPTSGVTAGMTAGGLQSGVIPGGGGLSSDGIDTLTLSSDPFIGQVGLFAGNFAPRGWALAQGQLLAINQNPALFSILGTQFGGDGRTTFALPDLRGRTPVGAGQGPGLANVSVGDRFGAESLFLTEANLPAHGHTVERAVSAVPLPAGVWLLAGGLLGLGALRRAGRG
ncbi:MAG: tail fiber protein, partial [Paracoccaceae bacterium]|nr:tail fiber protein [Paracoccaceae bacterium]